jgi:hypothetical protein
MPENPDHPTRLDWTRPEPSERLPLGEDPGQSVPVGSVDRVVVPSDGTDGDHPTSNPDMLDGSDQSYRTDEHAISGEDSGLEPDPEPHPEPEPEPDPEPEVLARQSTMAWARANAEQLVSFVVVSACSLLVLRTMHPSLLVLDTTPTGGDLGAHVWAPAYLRDSLIPKGRLAGWAPSWYAGFPAYQFYMVVPPLAIVLLDLILPYNVAFKLVSVSGVISLPIAAWAFGRLARLPFPVPPMLAVASLPFLFDRGFQIYGGNLASTLAGEFNFSIALSLGVLYLGLLIRLCNERTGPAITAVVLALTVLCHLLVGIFVTVATLVVIAVYSHPIQTLRRWSTGSPDAAPSPLALLAFPDSEPPTLDLHDNVLSVAQQPVTGLSELLVADLVPVADQSPGLEVDPVWGWLPTPPVTPPLVRDATRSAAVRALPSLVTAVALTAFWVLPFWVNRHYTFDMGWYGLTDYWKQLLPSRLVWAHLLAMFALVRLMRDRHRTIAALFLTAVVMGLVFRFLPKDGRLWNARMVQFVWFTTYLLAGIGAAELGHQLATVARRGRNRTLVLATPVLAAMIAIIYVALPNGGLGLTGRTSNTGREHWLGLSAKTSYLPAWIHQNYAGYEKRSQWFEYKDINDTMARLGTERGCGRAMWEYDNDRLGGYGTPLSMMLLPYWTKGCIDSMEGLYFESSPSTGVHFLMAAEVTQKPSNPVTFRGHDNLYRPLDFDHGIEHMRLFGVRYYMALSPEAIALAGARSELTEVARSGPWIVYELSESPLVTGIDRLPYVESGSAENWKRWRDTGLATWDLINGSRFYAAPRGPQDWPRISKGDPLPIETISAPAQASNVSYNDDSVSFDVDQIGKPVLVKINYFPNWKASGAQGPYRVTPNFMVVIPTATHVELHYTRSRAEWAGVAGTLLGIMGVAALTLFSRRRTRTEAIPDDPELG